jgi:hypothetical protein
LLSTGSCLGSDDATPLAAPLQPFAEIVDEAEGGQSEGESK